MKKRKIRVTHSNFLKHINKLHGEIAAFLSKNQTRIDYVVPVLRSGAVPAVYLAQRLVAVKFAPIQVKWVAQETGALEDGDPVLLLNALTLINNPAPTLLVVDGNYGSGKSIAFVLKEIYKTIPNAKVLLAVTAKSSKTPLPVNTLANFYGFEYQRKEKGSVLVYFPWEVLEFEISHPDDRKENIFY